MSRPLQQRHRGYLEAEVPLQPIKQAGSFRMALCYPNLYFVGMSNLGFHSVYQMLNAHPDVLCERAFLPDDVDREDLERTGQPLTTVESGSSLRDFHVLAFSVSFENDYLHVLRMLRLSGIPLRAKDRGPRDPVVVLGGAAVFLNPEPLAPFADLIAVGEGEALVPAAGERPGRRVRCAAGHRRAGGEGRLLRALAARGALSRGRHRGRLRRARARHPAARLAGQDGAAAVRHPHAPTPRCP